jgi:hypothetical protein
MSPLYVGPGLSWSTSVFYGVFVAENICGVGDKGSGDIIMVYLQMLLEVFFEHDPDICLFLSLNLFLVKSKTSTFRTTLLSASLS